MPITLHKASTLAALDVRRDPHWGAPIATGQYVGFRKLDATRGTWIARYRTPEGKQKFNSLGAASATFTYDAAKAAAQAWFATQTGLKPSARGLTVEQVCRAYVDDRRTASGEAAARDIDMRFRRTIYGGDRYDADNPRHANHPPVAANPIARLEVADLTVKIIKAWRDAMTGARRQGVKPLAARTVNRNLVAFKAALNLAAVEHRLSADLQKEWGDVPLLTGVGQTTQREIFLDVEQRRALLASITDPHFRDLAEAGMLTGARVGELCDLKVSHFDARTGTLTIVRGTQSDKKKRARGVPLSPRAVELFTRCAKGKKADDVLLAMGSGARWAHSDYDHLMKIAAAGAKLPQALVFYTLRHSHITQCLLDGMATLTVAKMTGTSLKMIEEHYGHLVEDQARRHIALVNLL